MAERARDFSYSGIKEQMHWEILSRKISPRVRLKQENATGMKSPWRRIKRRKMWMMPLRKMRMMEMITTPNNILMMAAMTPVTTTMVARRTAEIIFKPFGHFCNDTPNIFRTFSKAEFSDVVHYS
jgi:hypothetical protein